jgi:hypothetical protein
MIVQHQQSGQLPDEVWIDIYRGDQPENCAYVGEKRARNALFAPSLELSLELNKND